MHSCDKPCVDTCCFCFSLRTGCKLLTVFFLLETVIYLTLILSTTVRKAVGLELRILFTSLSVFCLLTVVGYIYAVCNEKPRYIRVFAYWRMFIWLVNVWGIIHWMIVLTTADQKGHKPGDTETADAVSSVLSMAMGSALDLYYIVVILSYAKKLEEDAA